MTAYTETTFDRSIWQSVPMANWTFEITAPDRLTVTRNGETKTVRIVPDGSFVVALRKTYIRAAAFLFCFFFRLIFHDFPWLHVQGTADFAQNIRCNALPLPQLRQRRRGNPLQKVRFFHATAGQQIKQLIISHHLFYHLLYISIP